jgi:hypothetical protein
MPFFRKKPSQPPAQPSGTGAPGRHAASGGRPRPRNPRAIRARVAQSCWTVILIFGLLAMGGGDVSGGVAFATIGVAGIASQQYLFRRRLFKRRSRR